MKGDPPQPASEERRAPKPCKRDHLLPQQPLLLQPPAKKEQGLPMLLQTKAALPGWCFEHPGQRKRREREPQRLLGSSPCPHPLGRQRWQELGGDGSKTWRACCPPASADATTRQEEKGRRSDHKGLTPNSTFFSFWPVPGTSQGRDLLLLPSWPKGRAAAPSVSNKHGSGARQS